MQANYVIGFATITSKFEQIEFKRLCCRLLFQEIYVPAGKDVHMEIRGFKVRTIGNAIRRLRYHKKEIRCRAIEDFRESSLRHSVADPFQTSLLVAIR